MLLEEWNGGKAAINEMGCRARGWLRGILRGVNLFAAPRSPDLAPVATRGPRTTAPAGRARVPVLALVLLALAGAAARAEVLEEHATQPYRVSATPGQPLRQALDAATPIREGGRRFHGYTRWNVRWSFRWSRIATGDCRITQVTTRLATHVQLPELHAATAAQRAVFERYLRALSHHEQGHVQLGRDAAHAIDHAIARLPAERDCATLERRANARGRQLLADHVAREKDYDRRTAHGASQGARLSD